MIDERGLTMVLHSIVITLTIYTFFVYILKYTSSVAEDKSIFIGSMILSYMILFGHGLPTKINEKIFN